MALNRSCIYSRQFNSFAVTDETTFSHLHQTPDDSGILVNDFFLSWQTIHSLVSFGHHELLNVFYVWFCVRHGKEECPCFLLCGQSQPSLTFLGVGVLSVSEAHMPTEGRTLCSLNFLK